MEIVVGVGGKMRIVVVLILVPILELLAVVPAESSEKIMVLGVIRSESRSVALLKDERSKKTKAVLLGQVGFHDFKVSAIDPKKVTLQRGSELRVIQVGLGAGISASSYQASSPALSQVGPSGAAEITSGFEKDGNTIRVSTDLRSHLLNNELSKILMQAAAVPKMENGKIMGFEMWEIEKGSIFELAGIQDGDLVTQINGHQLTDIAGTIRKLNSLREENSIQVQIHRNGKIQDLNLMVQ